MTRLFLDTNIPMDIYANRKERDAALALFGRDDLQLSMSSHSLITLHFLLAKFLEKERAALEIRKLMGWVEVLDTTRAQIENSLNSEFSDFEDGVQHHCAVMGKCDLIITDNLKDFSKSNMPVMTARQFLMLKTDN